MRPCPGPHCSRFVIDGEKYCATCLAKRERARGFAASRGYDRQWADYSRRWLRRFPICGQRYDGLTYAEHSACVQGNRRTRAEVTDHIVSIRDGGAIFDPANHQSLCSSCNRRKG